VAERWRAGGALSYDVGGERRLRDPDASSSLLPLRPNGHFPPAIVLVCVVGAVDTDSLPVLFVDRPGAPAALRGHRGVGIDHRRGLPRANCRGDDPR
jgi:hypothetical protein